MHYAKILEGVWVLEGIASTEYHPSVTFTTRVDTLYYVFRCGTALSDHTGDTAVAVSLRG